VNAHPVVTGVWHVDCSWSSDLPDRDFGATGACDEPIPKNVEVMDETIAIPIAQQTASFVEDFCTFDQRRKETAIQSTVLQFHASLGCQMSSPIRKCTRAARLFTIDNVHYRDRICHKTLFSWSFVPTFGFGLVG
jgi:hypothetical protein